MGEDTGLMQPMQPAKPPQLCSVCGLPCGDKIERADVSHWLCALERITLAHGVPERLAELERMKNERTLKEAQRT